jgi:HPt (histidine-containing phosphotransfer) domain-containing protein
MHLVNAALNPAAPVPTKPTSAHSAHSLKQNASSLFVPSLADLQERLENPEENPQL